MEKGDFIYLEFEGYTEKGEVFDSTKGDIAKKLYGKEGPLFVILGETPLLEGVEEAVYEMKEGEERTITLDPSKAFGFKDKRNVMILPLSSFEKMPTVGSVVSFENPDGTAMGVVKHVSQGRVMGDFNHPLAGKNVKFKLKIVKKIEDQKEKAEALLRELKLEFSLEDGKIKITSPLKEEDRKAIREMLDNYGIKVELEFVENNSS